jgi:hypothetical protein
MRLVPIWGSRDDNQTNMECVSGQYGGLGMITRPIWGFRDDNQANMEMPMY